MGALHSQEQQQHHGHGKQQGLAGGHSAQDMAASLVTQARVLTLGLSCYCDSCDGRELDCDQQLSSAFLSTSLHRSRGWWSQERQD